MTMTLRHQRRRRLQVTVIGNSQASQPAIELAEQVGEMLARLGCVVVSGGGTGVMEGASRGAARAGGLTIGILPGDDLNAGNDWLDVVLPSGIGYARNSANVLAADLVIAIAGSSGTLSEIAYAWLYNKPVLAWSGLGGWSEQLAGQSLDDRRDDRILTASTIEDLEQLVRRYLPGLERDVP